MTAQKATIGFAILLTAAAAAYGNINNLEPVPLDPATVPDIGTFWSLAPDGQIAPPLPFAPPIPDASVYSLGKGQFFVGTEDGLAQSLLTTSSSSAMMLTDVVPDPGGDPGTNSPPDYIPNPRDSLRNAEKFAGHVFSLLDTNDVATSNPDLYNALTAFPEDTSTVADLQIMLYQTNVVLIKANHFDYSAEGRDFALLVSSKVESPTWKAVDLAGNSDSIDGWLIQGLVSNWKVTDAMFMMVSNISLLDNAFFRAIPYSGPQVQLTGAQTNDVVSGTVTLQAQIMDLSGATNQQLAVDIDGITPRYTLGESNTISIDTRYTPNGYVTVNATVSSSHATINDPTNAPMDTKLQYDGSTQLPLDFENPTYVAFASDNCSPDVGINYIMFGIDQAQDITATINDPSTGTTLASYSGYVPYAAVVELPWDFTDAFGAPYTNDTYTVTFTAQGASTPQAGASPNAASPSTTLIITNTIDRQGVRTAAGCIVTYEEEDPSTPTGSYLNTQASQSMGAIAVGLYSALYYWDWASLTQFSPADIGANRDNPAWSSFPLVLTSSSQVSWFYTLANCMTNLAFSDFDYGQGHGNGTGLGGGPRGSTWVTNWIDSHSIQLWLMNSRVHNWRIRKAAMWACYTGSTLGTAGGLYPTWFTALGVRPTPTQLTSFMNKNAALVFDGELPQGGSGWTSVQAAAAFDNLWVMGPNAWPGECDPTYSIAWTLAQIKGMYPGITNGTPHLRGYPYLPYTGVYDSQLTTGDHSMVKP